VIGRAWHWLTCPIRRRWRRWRIKQPLWRDDKTAQMLGVAQYGCPGCGRGSVVEWDAAARALCAAHQAASPTRQPCAACVDEAGRGRRS
jgi:hypothetical protein